MALLRARLSDERGWTLLIAILMMTIMLATVLSVANFIDGQTKQGADSRKRETAFNLTEAALNAQIFALTQSWPGTGNTATPYPTCTQATATTVTRCPNTPSLSALVASPDATGATWQTLIRDNTGTSPNFYSDALTLGQPAYDANGDHQVWVRSTATARGKSRTMVTLVRVEEQAEDIPHAALISGSLDMSNNGNKTIVNLTSSSGANGFVGVRCTVTDGEPKPCLGSALGTSPTQTQDKWDALVQTQLSPFNGHTQQDYSTAPAMTQAARDRLKARAVSDGTYYATCPSSLPSGTVVWIESGDCSYTANRTYNSQESPGMLVVDSGTLVLGGTSDFWGIVYLPNLQNSSGVVMTVSGNMTIHGGVLVDGPGITMPGSSKQNIIFDDSAFKSVKSYGTAGMIQNTWREIKG